MFIWVTICSHWSKMITMTDIDALRASVTSACVRYETHFQPDSSTYYKTVWQQFQQELDHVLLFLVQDRNIAFINEMSRSLLFQSILAESETGLDVCVWGPPLGISPVNDFCYGLIGYGAVGVMESARPYPEKTTPFTDYLIAAGFDGRTATALSIMVSTAILNTVAEKCLSNHLPDVAQIVMRMSQFVSKSVVSHADRTPTLHDDPQDIFFKGEEMHRHTMLEHIFLRTIPATIRIRLLEIASQIHLFRKMIHRLTDSNARSVEITATGDRSDLPALTHLIDRVMAIRADACSLCPDYRDAVDVRLHEGLERTAGWMAAKQMDQRITAEA